MDGRKEGKEVPISACVTFFERRNELRARAKF